MEFKDKLKKLRAEKGISQQALANAIFVSRSAVAKWENGLGLPSADSCEALANYFSVSIEYLRSKESDIIFVEKKQKLYKLLSAIFGLFLILGSMLSFLLVFSIFSDHWGLTSELAAGEVWMDNPRLEFSDYHIYYSAMDWTLEGEDKTYQHIAVFKPVRHELIGYSYSDRDYSYRRLYFTTESGKDEPFAIIYSIKGKHCYYNIITSHSGLVPKDFISFEKISVDGKERDVLYNSFFITDELPSGVMMIDDTKIIIGSEFMQR